MSASAVGGGFRNYHPSYVRSRNDDALKKGPWSKAEDMLLLEYVEKHGEGNWNAVQRNSGLMRCGKSCRLRWANHLRPNLKKGAFSPEEEQLIVHLHAKLGNKWARMAAQIPGRTDNEIKNYWNTRLKRRQREGLPIYPHQQEQQQKKQKHHNSPSSSSISSLNGLSLDSSNSLFSSSSFFNSYNADGSPMEALGLPSIQGAKDFEAEFVGNFHEPASDLGFTHHISSYHHRYGGAEAKAPEEGMDEELMNLLDNFPLSVPIPDWNRGDGSESPCLNNGTSSAMHDQSIVSEYNPVVASTAAANHEWNFGFGSFLGNDTMPPFTKTVNHP